MSIIVRSNDAQADAQVNAPVAKADAPTQGTPSAPEASASEQKESETSESSETEGKESDSTESESEEEADAGETETEKDKPKKKGFQRRVEKLNARVTAAQQEAEYWKREALKSATEPKAGPKLDAEKAPSPEGKPTADDFDTHAEYIEALTDWKTDQKFKEHAAKQEKSSLQSEQEKLIRSHTERVKSFAEKTEDFQDVLENVDDIPVSPAVRDIVLSSENGPELMYELAKNRDEYARICKLSPLSAAREIGKLESRIALEKPSEAKPEPKKITNAPKPLEPVKAGGKGSPPKAITDPSLSQAEYERLRREQIKKGGRR